MNIKVGDKIKYHFPYPVEKHKDFVKGTVSFIDIGRIGMVCEDNSQLVISFKNYDMIEIENARKSENELLIEV